MIFALPPKADLRSGRLALLRTVSARSHHAGFGIAAFDLLVPAARLAVLREALAPSGQMLEIERAELGAEAGLIGAGLIAFEGLR